MGLKTLISRAVVKLVDSSKKMQTLQVEVLKDEVRDDVEHFEPYGFSSVPKPGAEALTLNVGGSSDHTVAVCIADRRYRPTTLSEGQVCLYDSHGHRITLTSSRVAITGNTKVTGTVQSTSGYTVGDTPDVGVSGSLTITDAATGSTCTIVIGGGIITGVVPTPGPTGTAFNWAPTTLPAP